MPAPRSTAVEKMLDDRGVSYELIEIDLELVDLARSQQNQARISAPLNQSTVETYTAGIERGDEFPPIVVYKTKGGKYVVIDGNHRMMAAIGAQEKSIWAYLVDAKTPVELITVLTYEANTKHGLPTSEAERAKHAVYLIENAGETIKSAAARMNLSGPFLNRYYTKVRADSRAETLGVNRHRWYELAHSVRTRLLTLRADETFLATIDYALKARLTSGEIDGLISKLNKESSVTQQLTILQEEETQNQQRIQNVASGKERPKQAQHTGPRRSLYNSWTMVETLKGDNLPKLVEAFTPLEAQQWQVNVKTMRERLEQVEELLAKRSTE